MTLFDTLSFDPSELAAAKVAAGPFGVPVPTKDLRAATGPTEVGDFLLVGEAWAQHCYPFFSANPKVLDVGCGCGKMARFFIAHPTMRYVGFDILRPSINWANGAFSHYADRFTFKHVDIYSPLYNPEGKIDPNGFRFPFDDGAFDFAICGSLFTHLLQDEMRRYLSEISRCLMPGGRLLASIHTNVPEGTEFSGDAARIDMTEALWLRSCTQYGLTTHRYLGGLYGQVCYVMEKVSATSWAGARATAESVA